jgi:hypothetical protein
MRTEDREVVGRKVDDPLVRVAKGMENFGKMKT